MSRVHLQGQAPSVHKSYAFPALQHQNCCFRKMLDYYSHETIHLMLMCWKGKLLYFKSQRKAWSHLHWTLYDSHSWISYVHALHVATKPLLKQYFACIPISFPDPCQRVLFDGKLQMWYAHTYSVNIHIQPSPTSRCKWLEVLKHGWLD